MLCKNATWLNFVCSVWYNSRLFAKTTPYLCQERFSKLNLKGCHKAALPLDII